MKKNMLLTERELRKQIYALLRSCAESGMSAEDSLEYIVRGMQDICDRETLVEALRDMARTADNRRFASCLHNC